MWRASAVRPTFDLALFRATHSFLSRSVPHASVSVGFWPASDILLSDRTEKVRMSIDVSFSKGNKEVVRLSRLALSLREVVSRYVNQVVESLVQNGGFGPSSTLR